MFKHLQIAIWESKFSFEGINGVLKAYESWLELLVYLWKLLGLQIAHVTQLHKICDCVNEAFCPIILHIPILHGSLRPLYEFHVISFIVQEQH